MQTSESWRQQLGRRLADPRGRLHFVGVGNLLREDDGVGLRVAGLLGRRLRGLPSRRFKVHPPALHPERLFPKIPEDEAVVIFDAVRASMDPGSVVCASLDDTRYGFFATHDVPLKLVPGLAGRAGEVLLVGIQPESLDVREGLTPAVEAAAEAIVSEIVSRVGGP